MWRMRPSYIKYISPKSVRGKSASQKVHPAKLELSGWVGGGINLVTRWQKIDFRLPVLGSRWWAAFSLCSTDRGRLINRPRVVSVHLPAWVEHLVTSNTLSSSTSSYSIPCSHWSECACLQYHTTILGGARATKQNAHTLWHQTSDNWVEFGFNSEILKH